jgi:hypothetical protein
LALSLDQQTLFRDWCLTVTRERVRAIVAEKHLRSYGKAARLLTTCAEALRLRD